MNDDDLQEFVALQETCADSPKSWTVSLGDLDQNTLDLSVKNPYKEAESMRDPEVIINEIEALDAESTDILERIREML